MSNNMDNSNVQDNEKRVDQNKRFNDDKPAHQEYSESNHHFVPQMTHGLIPVSRQEDNLYMQNVNVPKPPIPEDAEVCDAMNFLNRIKNEFSEDLVTYDNFLETMRDYKFGKIDADEVCKAVVLLFKEKTHLIDLFNEYLPNHLKFPPDSRKNEFMARNFDRMNMNQQHPQFRRNFINQKIMHPSMRPMISKMGPPPHLQHQPSHLSGLLPGMVPGFAPSNIPHPNSQSQLRMPPPNVQKMNPNCYNFNVPPKTEDETIKKKQANDFIQRVKKRYYNQPNVYKTFVEILQKFNNESNISAIRSEVGSLLWEHQDLIEDFEKDFITEVKMKNEDNDSIFKQLCKEFEDKNIFDEFLRILNFYNQNFISKCDLLLLVTPLLKNERQINIFKEFINEKEGKEEIINKLENCRKFGSYRILQQEIQNTNQDAIAREVLNTTCVSCPTFDSEDATFVFLKRNMFEDTLFRAEDDRSEASLVIERLDHLITSLEIVYSNLGSEELSIKDIGMSPGIIKEVLKNIYDDSASEILEGILTNPKTAIPILIKRLYSVNKDLREKLRQKHKVWNEQVERAYYKALDINGLYYKNIEKNNFSSKVLAQEADDGFEQDFSDTKIIHVIAELFNVFIKINQNESKKTNLPSFNQTVDLIFEIIFKNIEFSADFNVFCVYRFIFYLYEKIKEIKDLNLKSIKSSQLAVNMNLIHEYDVENRFEELINQIKLYFEKEIEPSEYEESVRILTDCKGYKLYNIKKVFSKLEKSIISLIENEESLNFLNVQSLDHESDDTLILSFKNNLFMVKAIKSSEHFSDGEIPYDGEFNEESNVKEEFTTKKAKIDFEE